MSGAYGGFLGPGIAVGRLGTVYGITDCYGITGETSEREVVFVLFTSGVSSEGVA